MQMWVKAGAELLQDIEQTTVPTGAVAIWYLGQMGFVIKGAGVVAYLDPYLVDSWTKDAAGNQVSRRRFPPPFAGSEVHNADLVLGTHNHSDHINVPTLTGLAAGSQTARFAVPAPHQEVLIQAGIPADRIIAARAGEKMQIGELVITPIPAAHTELEQDANGDYTALGYVLQLNGATIFHAGDTVEYPGMAETLRQYSPDICMLPINGRDMLRTNRNLIGNMNFREAADLSNAIGAKLLIPGHYDVFPHNGENPAFLVDYLYRAYPAQPFKIMAPGERLIYM